MHRQTKSDEFSEMCDTFWDLTPKLTQPTVLDPPLNVGYWFPNSYAMFIAAARCCFPDIIKNLQFDGDENDLYQGE